MPITATTKIVGVMGQPIAHSASPAMHNAAFAAMKLDWAYIALEVAPKNLRSALRGARDMNFVGVNLTVPHKILALEFCDEIDEEAKLLGAVNCISFRDGKIRGFNTDGYGFVEALKEEFNLELRGKRVLVLGAGGAGRAIAVKSAMENAAKVVVANRTASKIAPIRREISKTATKFAAIPLKSDAIARESAKSDVLVNATSVGLRAGESLGLSQKSFRKGFIVFDTIYNPAETELLRAAKKAGALAANGVSMLLHQGAKSFEIWTNRKPPLAVMRRALRQAVGGTP
jgi:shikimate dehydrogenase